MTRRGAENELFIPVEDDDSPDEDLENDLEPSVEDEVDVTPLDQEKQMRYDSVQVENRTFKWRLIKSVLSGDSADAERLEIFTHGEWGSDEALSGESKEYLDNVDAAEAEIQKKKPILFTATEKAKTKYFLQQELQENSAF
ncbi:MAG: hypothetical protein Q9208_008297 [Pyrenodesmia sp. 3 TL-2023]